MQKKNLDPEIELKDDEEEPSLPDLPDLPDDGGLEIDSAGSLGRGRDVIAEAARHAPSAPGVYRMIGAGGDVLYVGKAKNLKKRILAYARPTGLVSRIARMVAVTASIEFVSTATETEALLLEANLIKRLRPRFNVLLRDDKSFPYILITAGERPPQILKHRGARNREGDYFGPFAAVNAVNRTITALERAFLIRSCSDAVFESRTRPCLLFQIKRCSAPCTGEISRPDYDELVREATNFLSGRSRAVKDELAEEMDRASEALDFERAAALRDRLAALSAVQARQGINPRVVEEADVFAIYQDGGFNCIEVFFFRTGQNWGNRAYFPRADRTLSPEEVLGAFLAQFYDDKPCPRLILLSHETEDCALLAEALSIKSGRKVEISSAAAGREARAGRACAGQCPRGSGTQARRSGLAAAAALGARNELRPRRAAAAHRGLRQQPHPGHQRGRRDDRRRAGRAAQEPVPQVQHQVGRPHAGRRLRNDARGAAPPLQAAGRRGAAPGSRPDPGSGCRCAGCGCGCARCWCRSAGSSGSPIGETEPEHAPAGVLEGEATDADAAEAGAAADHDAVAWPDLVLIDGGAGQLSAAREIFSELGIADVPMVAIAKGPDRDAGRETFHMPGRPAFKLPPRDPVLYFVERLRDEAHRFAIGSHRQRRRRDIREAGLQEIAGIGPTRKRALLRHFGTLKAIERASIADLRQVAGVSDETARRIYDFFHDAGR